MDSPGGSAVCGGTAVWLAVAELRCLPGRSALWLYRLLVSGDPVMGNDPGKSSQKGVFWDLGGDLADMGVDLVACRENFSKNCTIYKIFICILEKMGYTRME